MRYASENNKNSNENFDDSFLFDENFLLKKKNINKGRLKKRFQTKKESYDDFVESELLKKKGVKEKHLKSKNIKNNFHHKNVGSHLDDYIISLDTIDFDE
jgi:hypothetical protein